VKSHPDDHASITLLTGKEATEERLKRSCENKGYLHFATHGYLAPGALRSSFEKAVERRRGTPVKELSDRADDLEIDLPGLMTGVVLAGANLGGRGPEDGILTAEEVAWLNLSGCDLVTLSACDTGLGVTEAGEGLIGLRRAFHLAGARTTITSLWRVRDDAMLELMTEFYRRLWSGHESKGHALRAAQLALLQENRKRFHQDLPGTWGALILEGDWR
jgi:CHAT domain-containing protein